MKGFELMSKKKPKKQATAAPSKAIPSEQAVDAGPFLPTAQIYDGVGPAEQG